MNKFFLLFTLVGILCLIGLGACQKAAETTAVGEGVKPVYTAKDAAALKGYDAVAYFSENQAMLGKSEFNYEWQGAKWQFASAEHRDQFAKEPQKYAPQFGGYCAWAVSHGYTAKGDPTAWKVVDGKLYLNYNDSVKQRWEQDQANFISVGAKNWPEFLKKKPEHKGGE